MQLAKRLGCVAIVVHFLAEKQLCIKRCSERTDHEGGVTAENVQRVLAR